MVGYSTNSGKETPIIPFSVTTNSYITEKSAVLLNSVKLIPTTFQIIFIHIFLPSLWYLFRQSAKFDIPRRHKKVRK